VSESKVAEARAAFDAWVSEPVDCRPDEDCVCDRCGEPCDVPGGGRAVCAWRYQALDALIAAAKREAFEEAACEAAPDTDGLSDGERLFADGRRAAALDIRALAAKVTP